MVIAALTAAGFPCDSCHFLGHLPTASARLTRYLIDSLEEKRSDRCLLSLRLWSRTYSKPLAASLLDALWLLPMI